MPRWPGFSFRPTPSDSVRSPNFHPFPPGHEISQKIALGLFDDQ
jgi:hypothetical protein